jgi:hypothetical protein
MLYKTLGDQRARLRARLGFSAMGATGVQQTILNSFLFDAQVQLYWTHDWNHLKRYEDVTLGMSDYLLDYPTLAHWNRIKGVSVLRGTVWSPFLKKGIDPEMYTTQSTPSWPQRIDLRDQIEFWPITDQAYTVRIYYILALGSFELDGDRSYIDDDLIFELALGLAKAHYRHPDAKVYTDAAQALLTRLKGKNWSKDVFNRNDYKGEPLVMPVTVP